VNDVGKIISWREKKVVQGLVSSMATKSLSRIRQEKTRRLLILVNDQEDVVKENVKQEDSRSTHFFV
jgi:hypothetical protein